MGRGSQWISNDGERFLDGILYREFLSLREKPYFRQDRLSLVFRCPRKSDVVWEKSRSFVRRSLAQRATNFWIVYKYTLYSVTCIDRYSRTGIEIASDPASRLRRLKYTFAYIFHAYYAEQLLIVTFNGFPPSTVFQQNISDISRNQLVHHFSPWRNANAIHYLTSAVHPFHGTCGKTTEEYASNERIRVTRREVGVTSEFIITSPLCFIFSCPRENWGWARRRSVDMADLSYEPRLGGTNFTSKFSKGSANIRKIWPTVPSF